MIEGVPKVYYFTDRKKIANEIKLPQNNISRPYLVIAPNEVGTGYSQLPYNELRPWLTEHISEAILRELVLSLNSAHTYALSEQKRYEKYTDSNIFFKLFLYIAVFCIAATLVIFVYVGLYNSKFQRRDEAIQVAFVFGLVAVAVSIIMTFLSCKSIPTFRSYTKNLSERLLKVIEYWNKKLYKQGLVLVPGTKLIWIELWKIKQTGKGQIPYISLLGRDPIVDYKEEEIEGILDQKAKELEETYARRFGTKYYLFDYLKEHLQKETARRQRILNEKAKELERFNAQAEMEKQRMEKERLPMEQAPISPKKEPLPQVSELNEDLEQSPNASQRKLRPSVELVNQKPLIPNPVPEPKAAVGSNQTSPTRTVAANAPNPKAAAVSDRSDGDDSDRAPPPIAIPANLPMQGRRR